MDSIHIPLELRQRIELGIQQAKLENKGQRPTAKRLRFTKMIAASVFVLILLSSIVFHNQVIAVIQKALQFIPGIGIVLEDDASEDRYVLQKPIIIQIDGGTVVITGMMVNEQMTYVTMSGTQTPRFESVKVINEQGMEYRLKSAHASWSTNNWASSFWLQGKQDIKGTVNMMLEGNPDIIIPIMLTKAETYESYQAMGETSAINDVTITAIANRVEDKARISLVAQHPQEFKIADYGLHGVHQDQKISVTDETGKGYKIERYDGVSGPANEFYFGLPAMSDVKNYTVTIPEINVIYNDKTKITLNIPSDKVMDVDQTFEIAGFPVKITKLERIDNDQLRVYIDTYYKENTSRALHNLRIDSMSHRAKVNEQTRALEYLQFDLNPSSKRVKLTISNPEVVIRGPWKFEWEADEYFVND